MGLKPSRKLGAGANTKGFNRYPVADAYGTALFKGDPVKLSAGFIQIAAADEAPLGIFMGCSYVDANGTPLLKPYLPASTTSTAAPIDSVNGTTNAVAYVLDDADITMTISADAALSTVNMGQYFNMNVVAGSTTSGDSGYTLDVATGSATSVHTLMLVGLVDEPGNELTDSTPKVEVKWAQHVDK